MELKHAEQIASLLNSENQLVILYTADKIISSSDNFIYKLDDNENITAFVEVKKIQWYQYEICHLTVSPVQRGKGLGNSVLNEAELKAKKGGGKILQCTIREDNTISQSLFKKNGFIKTLVFYYPTSGNNVTVWQKVISKKT